AIGARARLEDAGGRSLGTREVRSGGSLMAQSDLRLHWGLGSAVEGPMSVVITWPDGERETRRNIPIDRYSTLEKSPR
ncbi:MAG: ASPIC/UnbV domain-containing protein, partial [Acidobacteriota bacterium]